MVSIFDDEDVRDSFQRTDFKLMRTAAFSSQTLWDTLMEGPYLALITREQRYVCGRCGLIFASWKKFIAHQTRNKGGNHGIKSPLRVAVITDQCVSCGSTFADRPTAQNHAVNSWTRGTCRTDCSHMTWSLEEVTQSISCTFCAQELGDLETYYAHARLTHLPFPAPTIRLSRPAQLIRQPTKEMDTSGVHQERWSGRRGATTAKAAPTNFQQNQARRWSQRIDDSGGQAQSRRQVRAEEPQQHHAQCHPQKRITRCETCRQRYGTLS